VQGVTFNALAAKKQFAKQIGSVGLTWTPKAFSVALSDVRACAAEQIAQMRETMGETSS